MRFLRASTGQPIEIALGDEINAGGEARLYSVATDSGLVAKVYRHPKKETGRKLHAMLDNPPSDPTAAQGHASIAWPVDLLRTESDRTEAGYLMPRVVGANPVIDLYNPSSRRDKCPLFNYQYLYRTAQNMAAVMHALHSRDYVIGDVNESNILVMDTALITVVDTDSFQVPDRDGKTVFHCPVAKPEFTPPELQGKLLHYVERTPAHDRFGLAVLIFQLLMEGTHPFAGVYAGDDPAPYEERIAAGHYPHGAGTTPYRPLPMAPPIEILPPVIRLLFQRCFEDGHLNPPSRPHASAWVKALREAEHDLIVCTVNDQHRYGSHLDACPWCRRAALLGGRDPYPSKERVLAGLHHEPIPIPVQSALPSSAPPSDAVVRTPAPEQAGEITQDRKKIAEAAPISASAPPPKTPPAPQITYTQRTAPRTKPASNRYMLWLAVVALLIIAVAATQLIHPNKPTGAGRSKLPAQPSSVVTPIPASDLRPLFAKAQAAIAKGQDTDLSALIATAPELAKSKGKDDWTLLHFAAYHGQADAARLLLDAGADTNAREKDAFTPLHLASQNGKTATAELLLQKGAEPNARESVGWTPLHFAAQEGHADIATLLLANGADPNLKDKQGLTPLAVAAKERKPRLEEIIREHGGGM